MTLKLMQDKKQDEGDVGVWFHVARNGDELIGWTDADEALRPMLKNLEKSARVKIAPFGSRSFRQHKDRLDRASRRFRLADGTLPPDVDERNTIIATANHVLLDWEGIETPKGESGPYSPAKGAEVLEQSHEFQSLVVRLSLDLRNDRAGALKEDAEVLGEESGGRSGGPEASHDPGTGTPS